MPTKTLIHCAERLEAVQNAGTFGVHADKVTFRYEETHAYTQGILGKLGGGLRFAMKSHGVEVVMGHAQIVKGHRVLVSHPDSNKELIGKHILIATGGRARVAPGIPVDGETIVTTQEFLKKKSLPKSIVIVGGGPIGVEFAYILHAFGVKVTLLEYFPRILPREDHEVALALEMSLRQRGIDIHIDSDVKKVEKNDRGVYVEWQEALAKKFIQAECVFIATGIEPNVQGLFKDLSVKLDAKNCIAVDENFETSEKGIYAVGDVIGGAALAHVAMHQGAQVVETLFGKGASNPIEIFPQCVYSQPQVASVGLTEATLQSRNIPYKSGKFPFAFLGKTVATSETEGFVKILASPDGKHILGVHILGTHASEMISECVLAMQLKATLQDLLSTIRAHPSAAEAITECVSTMNVI
jgi:dihydrolipoamide dehydrogenase